MDKCPFFQQREMLLELHVLMLTLFLEETFKEIVILWKVIWSS